MKKAVLIGIDYFNDPKVSLRGCINDIITTRNMLIDAYDYVQENITILRDDFGNFIQPTRTNILSELNRLADTSVNLEEIWFHYSGHGSQLQDQNSENKELRNIIIPANYEEAGYIYDTELFEIIKKIRCRAIFVFDCCHSGSVCDMPWTFEYTSENELLKTHTYAVSLDNQHIYVLSGCRDNQSSADSSNNLDQSVGAFSNAIVESLRESHHNISIMNLYENASSFLLKNGYAQKPILSSSCENPEFVLKKG
jgi:hypothetical protein